MENEEPKMCTTSGRPVDVVRAEQTESAGQHKDYIVLCPDERAKGFVRPFRNKYIHVGQSVCAKLIEKQPESLETLRDVCGLPYKHDGECAGQFFTVSGYDQADIILKDHRKGGCGVETRMSQDLSETYARDLEFYGATFCVGCNKHLPVGEFVWSADGQEVGS
jgi:hypothetical protein